ncbi:hypothetical protein XI06_20205 [Bradyrhizobium sp. CCBAU 11434]|uniref:hypothetical protein n=1 Tax=Bradyrhizobium sp. CCBAU 11434 TaxID=1630885 RepID=UPI0023056F62|nr:hypothetical protein [Bradyrhizobium sp. CCBAU 11434]MDA9522543.1 hypothetical protein [Bradyrhizobium sp. CCBAU 11434]
MAGKFDRDQFQSGNNTRVGAQPSFRGPRLHGLKCFGWFGTALGDHRPRQRVTLTRSFHAPRRDY